MAKKLLISLFLIVALGAGWFIWGPKGEPAFELEEGFASLYDGKSLAGWRVIGGGSTFQAKGDDIVGRHGPGKNTFLRTEQEYGDFTLRMQMRWDEPGNSGILFRAQQRGGDGRAYGYQYELDASDRAWSAGIYDEARRGWLADLTDNDLAREAVNLAGWNDIEIQVKGARLQTWINGVQAADIVDGLDDSGYIALQVHSGDKGVMRWRHIRIQEHEPVARPGQGMDTVLAWLTRNVDKLTAGAGIFSGELSAGPAMISAKRLLSDATVRLTVPVCGDQHTRVRMRFRAGQAGESYAQLSLGVDTAQASIVLEGKETAFESVDIEAADRHSVIWTSVGDSMTVTVGEAEVLRTGDTGLGSRGKFQILPAACGTRFVVSDFAWLDLKERRDEVDFYKTLDNKPAPALSPEQALQRFSIAPGYEIELVAAEPLVEDPVAMAWDEAGRLYVVEMRGYMPDAYGTGSDEPVGQVVRLEDSDGDGLMDSSEVFLGGLVNPRAIAVVNEGILIGEPPNLWLCQLSSPESLCENKRAVADYAPDLEAGNVEHLENGLYPGLDNWLYNAKSARGMQLKDGSVQIRTGVFRGQWGLGKDDYGRLFYNNNSSWLQADLFSAEDLLVANDHTDYEGLGVELTELSEVHTTRVNPGVNRAYLQGTLRADGRLAKATGVSGLAIYRGNQFPNDARGNAFVPESAGNVVARFKLVEEGMQLKAEHQLYADERWGQREFLASTDERFRPVDLSNGPDGALYVIDMYRGIIQDVEFLTDELREQIFERGLDTPIGMGRIWRVRATGSKPQAANLGDLSATELVAQLKSENGWVRDTAQRLLLASPGAGSDELRALLSADKAIPAIHALWVLHGRNELTEDLLIPVLEQGKPRLQQQALRAGSGLFSQQTLVQLAQGYQDATQALRMQLAFTMGAAASDVGVREQLAALLVVDPGIYLQQAVVRAVRGQELLFLAELLANSALSVQSESNALTLATLVAASYRGLRPDLSDTEAANPKLLELLALVAGASGESEWQQLAMLQGLHKLTFSGGFSPALLTEAPPIFADASISEKSPLWDARLMGRKAFTWPGDEFALGIKPLSPEQLQLMAMGELFYTRCASCHGANGNGTTGLAPALAGASWVTGPPEWLGRIILQGMNGRITINGEDWNGIMPPHGEMADLDDETFAGLMTYLRRSWGNKADPVSLEAAQEIRGSSSKRKKSWTAVELQAVSFDRGWNRFVGKYKYTFITLTVAEVAEGLQISAPMQGETVLSQVSDTEFKAAIGGAKIKLQFVEENDGSVNSIKLQRGSDKITLQRK
jgi:glucose/arabinose dehydrogenase/mono/diheme cytochrome c family protein